MKTLEFIIMSFLFVTFIIFTIVKLVTYFTGFKFDDNKSNRYKGTLNIITQKNEEPFLTLDIKDDSFIFNEHIKEVTFVINRKDIKSK